MDLKELKTSATELSGKWFQDGDASFKVASINSPAYKEAVQEGIEQNRELFRRAARRHAPPNVRKQAREKREEITREAIAKHLLLDWKNVTENGSQIAFSKEAALDLMTRYPKFADLIAELTMEEFSDDQEMQAETVESLKKG